MIWTCSSLSVKTMVLTLSKGVIKVSDNKYTKASTQKSKKPKMGSTSGKGSAKGRKSNGKSYA